MQRADLRQRRLPPLLAIACLPVLSAYAILLRLSVPIPLLDDYPAILRFAEHFQEQPSRLQKLLYLAAAQHTDYKLLLVHSVVALQLVFLHHVSLSFLIGAGNLAPLLILLVLWANAFRKQRNLSQRLFLFLPVPFLLFQLNYAEAFDWAMGSLQSLGVIAFALLSIHLLLRSGRTSLVLATAAAVLAVSASASGFLLMPIGCLALFLRRCYRAMLVWCIPFAAMLLVYNYRYVRVPAPAHAGAPQMALFFLSFLGSAYENMHHRPLPNLSILLGAVLCAALAYSLRNRRCRDHLFHTLSTLFIFGTAALVTLGRSGMGLEASLSGRYKIYSDLLLILTYLVLAECALGKSQVGLTPASRCLAMASMTMATLLFAASGIAGYKLLSRRRGQLVEGLRQYEASSAMATPMLSPNGAVGPGFADLQENARSSLTRAIRLGLYRAPILP